VVTICTAQWSLYVPHSGHYMYGTVVTTCTTNLTINNSTFCPHSVFVRISEQTAIISLYSIDWLVYITETECVYCAVRTGSLCITVVNVKSFKCSHASTYECDQNGTVTEGSLREDAVTEPSRHASTGKWNISVNFLQTTVGTYGAPNTPGLDLPQIFRIQFVSLGNIISAATLRHQYSNNNNNNNNNNTQQQTRHYNPR